MRAPLVLLPALLGLSALATGPVDAAAYSPAREPVLKQIHLPHHYYYREMYLPQATSGPGSAAWSPDGRSIAVSMQGSLWRLDLAEDGSGRLAAVATQLTSGPGYDYQPDWSADGRFIAYASYREDAVELWLLETATGRARPLTRNRAVNVEPRWSPDGRRLAFVSTLHEGRFHIHTLALGEDGEPGAVERLTEDHDSGLPRYYYSRFDHFLSPVWSPDGREILFVSNRGHLMGTGGFWRMEARPGAEAREIHYEETNWKARPDWSPDGRRVVYASYEGRPWHQLWLMTSEGGDVFPLTYGDFDMVDPRWSRDGRRIACISNEGGNTSLWVIDLPGGRRRAVEIRSRHPLGPVGRLLIRTLDAGTGRAVAARLSVTGPDGRSFAPDDALRHADEAFDRAERPFEYAYFHSAGVAQITVPAGRLSIEATHGLEYRVERRQITVAPGSTRTERIVLRRLDDLPARGWWSGDLHVHMNYGGAYRNDPARLASQARSEDLHVVESLIVNKEQRIPDVAYFTGRPDKVSSPGLLIVHGQEFHTSVWGHLGLLGLLDHLLLPDYTGYANTAAASLYPDNATVLDLAHAQGACAGYVHPYDTPPDPSRRDEPLTHSLPADVALGKVDYLEVVGFSDHLTTAAVWYRLLNCGFRLPAGAGTDAMANFASLRGPVGMNRVFVEAGPRLDHARFLAALKAGRSFATNGPLLSFTLGGRRLGDELALPEGRHSIEARATLRSIVPVDHLEIVGGGKVVADLPLAGDRTSATWTGRIPIDSSGWYSLRAYGDRPRHPVLDVYPYATTSPVYVSVGGRPARSRADAEFFLAWIDRLVDAARAHGGWNTEEEKDRVLSSLGRARAEFQRRASE